MTTLSQTDRLSQEVGKLTAQLESAKSMMTAYVAPRTAAIRGQSMLTAYVCGVEFAVSCDVEEDEPPCHDPDYAHPGSSSSVQVSHLWVNGQWVDAEELLGVERAGQLGETLFLESEI